MSGNLDPGSRGDRSCSQPSADATNPHEVRHHIVTGSSDERIMKGARPIEIFADLHGGLQFARELRVARQIVVSDRFLEPMKPCVIERVAAYERIPERQALV